MPLKVAWGGDLTNYSSPDPKMVRIEQCLHPLLITQRQVQQKLTVIFKRGRSKGFRQNIGVLLFRSYELNVNLLGTK